METAEITLDEENYKKAIDFFNVYEYEKHIALGSFEKKTYLGNTQMRQCRFCGKGKPETTFRKAAHVIPQFLGNRYFLSAHECDKCNKLFGDLYENSFANYIGILRQFTLPTVSKNNANPKYKEIYGGLDNKSIRLSIEKQTAKHFLVYHENPHESSVEFDRENKKLTLNAIRKPYVPLYVYKMLLKVALTIIDDIEIGKYAQPLAFLINNTQNELFKGHPLCYMYVHTIYGSPFFKAPVMYLYRRKSEELKVPAQTFILYAGNHIYQIFIPLHKDDEGLQGENIRIYPYPLLLDQKFLDNGLRYASSGGLMDSADKKIGDEQSITFSYQDAKFHDE